MPRYNGPTDSFYSNRAEDEKFIARPTTEKNSNGSWENNDVSQRVWNLTIEKMKADERELLAGKKVTSLKDAAMATRALQAECKKGNYNASAFENLSSFVEQKAYALEIKPYFDSLESANKDSVKQH